MEIQTRSNAGELRTFATLREALDFANSKNSIVRELDEFTPPTKEQLEECVWKISFPLSTNERIRLVYEAGDWVLRQMGDEVNALLKERGLEYKL